MVLIPKSKSEQSLQEPKTFDVLSGEEPKPRYTGQEIQVVDPVEFLSNVRFSQLPETPIDKSKGSTTVSVLNTTRLQFTNTSATTVTNLTDAQEGQTVYVIGDGYTTLNLPGGVNFLLANGTVYDLFHRNGEWKQVGGPGFSPVAGAGIGISGSTISNLYVGKSVSLFSGSLVENTSGIWSGVIRRHAVGVDLTGMTQMRVSFGYEIPSYDTPGFALRYSTNNGSSWTDHTSDYWANYYGAGQPVHAIESWKTLPTNARNANTLVSVTLLTSVDTTIYSVSFEFKP
jgi:hypothetical protein